MFIEVTNKYDNQVTLNTKYIAYILGSNIVMSCGTTIHTKHTYEELLQLVK